MKPRFSALTAALLTVLSLSLAACSSGSDHAGGPLTPVPNGPVDPSDDILRVAVADFLQTSGAPVSSKFQFSRFDLDADGRRDALVLFSNPYGYWCDINGCTMLVLKAGDDRFTLINAIQPVRGPLYIGDSQSNGWKDIVVRVSGRWNAAKDVAMRYNGHEYPQNPDALPPFPKGYTGQYVRVLE